MRRYNRKERQQEQGRPCISHCACDCSRRYDSDPNDIGPENEGDEGYFSSDPDSDSEPIKKRKPAYDKPGDAIPGQGAFLMRAQHRLACVDVVAPANRVKAICEFFTFILQPAYAPFHRTYSEWRAIAHRKCDEFLAETTDAALRALCERFKMEFPLVATA